MKFFLSFLLLGGLLVAAAPAQASESSVSSLSSSVESGNCISSYGSTVYQNENPLCFTATVEATDECSATSLSYLVSAGSGLDIYTDFATGSFTNVETVFPVGGPYQPRIYYFDDAAFHTFADIGSACESRDIYNAFTVVFDPIPDNVAQGSTIFPVLVSIMGDLGLAMLEVLGVLLAIIVGLLVFRWGWIKILNLPGSSTYDPSKGSGMSRFQRGRRNSSGGANLI